MALIRYIPNMFIDEVHEFETQACTLVDAIWEIAKENSEFFRPLLGKRLYAIKNNIAVSPNTDGVSLVNDDIVELTHVLTGEWDNILQWHDVSLDPVEALHWRTPMEFLKVEFSRGIWISGGWLWELMEFPIPDVLNESTTYGWDGPVTSVRPNTPIAIVYGEHLIGGQLINYNVFSLDGKNNYLDILLALCEGEIAGIVKEDETGLVSIPSSLEDVDTAQPYIKLNDELVTNYDDVEWAGRVGLQNQTSIPGFQVQNSPQSYSKTVPALRDNPEGQWTSPEHTTGANTDQFTVQMVTPSLFSMYDSGNIKSRTIKYRIRYKKSGGSYVYSPTVAGGGVDHPDSWHKIRGKTRSTIRTYKTITPATGRGTYLISVQRYSPAFDELTTKRTVEDKLNTTNIVETTFEDLSHPFTALVAVRLKATDQLSGSVPNVNVLVRGRKIRVPDLGGGREFEDYVWKGTGNQFELASDGTDDISWDGSSYTTQWCSNPAYILRDFLINDRFGLGEIVTSSDLDEDTINDAAFRCWQAVEGSPPYTHMNELHVVLDTAQDPTQWLAQMAKVSRLIIYWSAGYIKFKYEEDETPSQMKSLFTMGNILENRFTTNYLELSKIPNIVEVTFANKDNDWKAETIEVADETEWQAGNPQRKASLNLIGVTSTAQALREAKLALNRGKYSRRAIEFTTTLGGIHTEPGDIVAVQHDIPQWGWGGRVIDGTSTTLVMDQEVPSAVAGDPTSYTVKVISGEDDTIQTHTLTAASGKTLTVASFSPTPVEDDVYLLGIVDSTIKEYRVRTVELTKNNEVAITATEHSASIYTGVALQISDDEGSGLPNPTTPPDAVTNLVVSDHPAKVGIIISFQMPLDTMNWDHADIYISPDDIHYTKIGEGYGDTDFEYDNVVPGLTYYIRVYSVNKAGTKNADPAEDSITVEGTLTEERPWTPSGLEIAGQGNITVFTGKDCKFSWRLNAPYGGAGSLDPEQPAGQGPYDYAVVKDFRVEIWNTDQTAIWRTENTTDTFYTYTWEKNTNDNSIAQRNFHIRVYQRNWRGQTSLYPAKLTVSNDAPDMSGLTPVTIAGMRSIRVDWSTYIIRDTDFDYFKLKYGTSSPPTGSIDQIGRQTTAYSLTGLEASTQYYMRVVPYDLFGVGASTPIFNDTTILLASPDISVDSILAKHIQVNELSAITASMGTLITGVIQSNDWATATGIQIDMDNQSVKMGGSQVNASGDYTGIFFGWDT